MLDEGPRGCTCHQRLSGTYRMCLKCMCKNIRFINNFFAFSLCFLGQNFIFSDRSSRQFHRKSRFKIQFFVFPWWIGCYFFMPAVIKSEKMNPKMTLSIRKDGKVRPIKKILVANRGEIAIRVFRLVIYGTGTS